VKVSQVMTKKPITATPETSVQDAAGLMVRHKAGCLPIIKAGKLVGIVTQTDMLKCLSKIAA